jgi:hypothetical protein
MSIAVAVAAAISYRGSNSFISAIKAAPLYAALWCCVVHRTSGAGLPLTHLNRSGWRSAFHYCICVDLRQLRSSCHRPVAARCSGCKRISAQSFWSPSVPAGKLTECLRSPRSYSDFVTRRAATVRVLLYSQRYSPLFHTQAARYRAICGHTLNDTAALFKVSMLGGCSHRDETNV